MEATGRQKGVASASRARHQPGHRQPFPPSARTARAATSARRGRSSFSSRAGRTAGRRGWTIEWPLASARLGGNTLLEIGDLSVGAGARTEKWTLNQAHKLKNDKPGTHRTRCPACRRKGYDDALAVTLKETGGVVAACDRIRGELGSHVLVVHHCGKDEARGKVERPLAAAAEVALKALRAALTVDKPDDEKEAAKQRQDWRRGREGLIARRKVEVCGEWVWLA